MAEQEGRLTLTREISRSGIATVWEGYDTGLGRKVLVKSIHPQYARESDLRMRFEREARAIAKLSHPNVVQIYDLHSGPEELSLILEFVEGESLGRLLKERGALPLEMAVTIAVQILAGLEKAHEAGIVHRDLKPDNVLVSVAGEVKITDFGLATLKDQPTVTQEGDVIGTPSYMAPEQAEGGEVSPATDVFALGLILFEMLTGRRVHQGATWGETIHSVLTYQPPKLEEFSRSIPSSIEPVLRKMLEKSWIKRFASAGEAHDALLRALPDGILPDALIADYMSRQAGHRHGFKGKAAERKRSQPVWIAAIMLLLIAVIAGSMYLVWGPSSAQKISKIEPSDTVEMSEPAIVPPPAISPPGESSPQKAIESTETSPATKREPSVASHVPADTAVIGSASHEPGFLDISCRPWASIYIADSLVGTTPLPGPLRLAAGNYNLVLLNPEIGLPISRTVKVFAGQTSDLKVNLYDYVARIRIASVKPWADVYVNGKLELRTPSSKLIIRPLGTYAITLKNPDYPEYTDTLTFREGEPIHDIRVDLTTRDGPVRSQ
jgi:serine/threonine protein kinase